jgi:hypothetical protein
VSISADDAIDPSFVEGLDALGLDELRSRRDDCQELENALSYARRLLHGRLDIVRHELEQRSSGGTRANIADIIERLPALLAEGSRSASLPRPPQDMAPGAVAEALVADLDASFPVSAMGSVPEMSDDDLTDLAERLAGSEHEISDRRRRLHSVIDRLQEEVIRRYRSGDASVDSLLDS